MLACDSKTIDDRLGRGRWCQRWWAAAACSLLLAPFLGCGLVANLIHAAGGNMVPAEYAGLEGRTVAIVCMSNSWGSHGQGSAAGQLADEISKQIRNNVEDVVVLPQRSIDDWFDRHDWSSYDMPELGDDVGANAIVTLDLASFSLHEGQTLYKGRADVEVVVYARGSIEKGKFVDDGTWRVDFQSERPLIEFPANSSTTTTEMSEHEFRRRFIAVLASRLARIFFPYELRDQIAPDPIL